MNIKIAQLSEKNNLLWIMSGCLLMLLGFIIFSIQNTHTDYTVLFYYTDGARAWLAQENLYLGNGYGFIYLPQSAILTIPFAFFTSEIHAELAWRIFWMILSGIAFYRLAKNAPLQKQSAYFFILILFFLTTGSDALRNGQMNVEMIIMAFASMLSIIKKKWWIAAFFITLGLLLKTTFIVYYLLFFMIFPQLRLKMILFAVISIGLPFLTAHPEYVIRQYHDAFLNLGESANYSSLSSQHYSEFAQIFTMLYAFHLYIPHLPQTILRLFFALFTLGLSLKTIKNHKISIYHQLMLIYTFSMVYLLLFNPRTENNDYIFMAPSLAWFWVFYTPKIKNERLVFHIIQLILLVFIIFHHDLSQFIMPPFTIWLAPLATLLWSAQVAYYLYFRKKLYDPAN